MMVKYVKYRRSDNSGIGTLKNGSQLITDPTEKAEILNHHFKSVFTTDAQPRPTVIPDNNTTIPPIFISAKGVDDQLRKLNVQKATRPDKLSARLLRETAHVIAPALSNIFQLLLDRFEVPTDWRDARVCAIFKTGDRYDPGNYRPISITCLRSEILEHIVNNKGFRAKKKFSSTLAHKCAV